MAHKKLANGVCHSIQSICLPLATQPRAFAVRGRATAPNFRNHFSCNKCNTTSMYYLCGMQSASHLQPTAMIGSGHPVDQCAVSIFACICYCHLMRTQSNEGYWIEINSHHEKMYRLKVAIVKYAFYHFSVRRPEDKFVCAVFWYFNSAKIYFTL